MRFGLHQNDGVAKDFAVDAIGAREAKPSLAGENYIVWAEMTSLILAPVNRLRDKVATAEVEIVWASEVLSRYDRDSSDPTHWVPVAGIRVNYLRDFAESILIPPLWYLTNR
jgi:hypothetical protein